MRDSTEDDRYLQPSAYYVVSIADKLLEGRLPRARRRAAARGASRRGRGAVHGHRRQARGRARAASARGRERDRRSRRVQRAIVFEEDPAEERPALRVPGGDFYFVYGQFDEARARFEPMMDEYCGKNEWGYKAWEKLISMSNFEGDAERKPASSPRARAARSTRRRASRKRRCASP